MFRCAVCVAIIALVFPTFLALIVGHVLSFPHALLKGEPVAYRRHPTPVDPALLRNFQQKHNPLHTHGIDYEHVHFLSNASAAVAPLTSLARYTNPGGLLSPEPQQPLTIRGWFVPAPGNQSLGSVILVHGAGHDRREFLGHVPLFHHAGYSVLVVDLRERGLSDGDGVGIGYGYREYFDVIAAGEFLRAEKPEHCNIVVPIGMSAGGAASLLAAASAPKGLFSAVGSISTFSSFETLLMDKLIDFRADQGEAPRRVMRMFGERFASVLSFIARWPSWVDRYMLSIVLHRLGHQQHEKRTPMEAVAELSHPVFLAHGEHDGLIHFRHFEAIRQSAMEGTSSHVRSVLVPRGGHSIHHLLDIGDRYREELLDFLLHVTTTHS